MNVLGVALAVTSRCNSTHSGRNMCTIARRAYCRANAPTSFVVAVLRTYLLGLVMVFVTCTFLILLLLASAAMPMLVAQWEAVMPRFLWRASALDFVASILLLTLLFLFTYRFMSDGRIRYSRLVAGAFTSAVLFTVGKMGIGYYLAFVNLASAFGAAGSLVVFLAWVYYSAQIVFFGAEVVRTGLPPDVIS